MPRAAGKPGTRHWQQLDTTSNKNNNNNDTLVCSVARTVHEDAVGLCKLHEICRNLRTHTPGSFRARGKWQMEPRSFCTKAHTTTAFMTMRTPQDFNRKSHKEAMTQRGVAW